MATDPNIENERENGKREDRFTSHALVEVRKYKILPFSATAQFYST